LSTYPELLDVGSVDEHASFYWWTIYTRTGPGLNPKSKGLIKAIPVGPETSRF
jgi:hypothetical protein